MHRRSLHLLIAFAWLVSLTGCQGLAGRAPDKLELIGEYTFRDREGVFTVLPGWSDARVVYHKEPVYGAGQQVTISLTDVSIDVTKPVPFKPKLDIGQTDEFTRTAPPPSPVPVNYRIKNVEAEEFVDGEWQKFSEFQTSPQFVARIGIAIVIDSSKSIDRQLGPAKSIANSLVGLLAPDWPGDRVWLAVMPFDRDAQLPAFTTDKETVRRSVSDMAVVPYTPLYDVVARACDAFVSFEKQQQDSVDRDFRFDKRWILLFTDGRDNYSESYPELERLLSKLAECNVAVYALGLQGLDTLDEADLVKLAPERYLGLSDLPREELRLRQKRVVDTIRDQSPALYDVTYVRNDQTIEQPRRIKLIFEIEK